MARMPLSPSTSVSRASAAVGATSAILSTAVWTVRIHSAPARVLPNPLPAMMSHFDQSPGGGSCAARAQNGQYQSSAALTSAGTFVSNFFCCDSGSEAR